MAVLAAGVRVRGVAVDHIAGARFERSGVVRVERAAGGLADCLILRERSSVAGSGGLARPAWNAERWSVGDAGTLELAHLRFGPDRPVALAAFARWRWRRGWAEARSVAPHACGPDRYWCLVRLGAGAVEVRWRVLGPAARQTVVTLYTTA